MKNYIGIDIGGTSIKFGIVTDEGEILDKWTIATNKANNGEKIPENIIESVRHGLKNNQLDITDISGIGIGVPGPIKNGVVLRAVNLGWKNLALTDLIESALNIPVVLLNDANAAALGEFWRGSNDSVKDALFVTLGTGVGGGVIIDNNIINGTNASGGEIGHIPVDSVEKRVCGCGNINCLETFASANGFLKTAQILFKEQGNTHTVKDTKEVFDLVHKGDEVAKEALDSTVDYLGKAIAGILNTIDPQEVIVGGGLAEAGEALLKPLTDKINSYAFPQIKNQFNLRKATLGNDAGILGATYHIRQQINESV